MQIGEEAQRGRRQHFGVARAELALDGDALDARRRTRGRFTAARTRGDPRARRARRCGLRTASRGQDVTAGGRGLARPLRPGLRGADFGCSLGAARGFFRARVFFAGGSFCRRLGAGAWPSWPACSAAALPARFADFLAAAFFDFLRLVVVAIRTAGSARRAERLIGAGSAPAQAGRSQARAAASRGAAASSARRFLRERISFSARPSSQPSWRSSSRSSSRLSWLGLLRRYFFRAFLLFQRGELSSLSSCSSTSSLSSCEQP